MAASAALALAAVLLACRSTAEPPRAEEHQAPERRRVIVLAASSLTDAFAALESAFEALHPGTDVVMSHGGSHVLALQIEQGAPADLFASADEAHVRELERQALVTSAERFAENELALIVPEHNPAGIQSLAELPRARRLVIGGPGAPVGAYTRALLERARASQGPDFAADVLARVVSEESNVRLVRAKVELGEADAAIVYRSDAVGARRARVVPLPDEVNVRASYWLAALTRAPEPGLARRFAAYVSARDGQAVLARHGFRVEP